MANPTPDDARVRRTPPERPWRHATGDGWQHGKVPPPPDDLTPAAAEAWRAWFASWWCSFWTPADLPGIRLTVRLYDQVERGEFQRSSELRLHMDTYGITEKGRQALRWRPRTEQDRKPTATTTRAGLTAADRLRIMRADEAPPNGNGGAA